MLTSTVESMAIGELTKLSLSEQFSIGFPEALSKTLSILSHLRNYSQYQCGNNTCRAPFVHRAKGSIVELLCLWYLHRTLPGNARKRGGRTLTIASSRQQLHNHFYSLSC